VKNWGDKVFDGIPDHGDEFADGFQPFHQDIPNDEEE
jgi:hypothetical protein